MDPVPLGIVFGAGFAALELTTLARLRWANRRYKVEALTAAAIERFMIGLLIPTADLGTPRWLTGVILGITLSLPSALLTKAYQPLIGMGIVAGLVLGIAAQILL